MNGTPLNPIVRPNITDPAIALTGAAVNQEQNMDDVVNELMEGALHQGVDPVQSEHSIQGSLDPVSSPDLLNRTASAASPILGSEDDDLQIDVNEDDPALLANVEDITPASLPEKIQAIKDFIENPGSKLSSQEILKEVMLRVKNLGSDYQVNIKPVLKGEPKPEVEPFTVPSSLGETYYKVNVEYQITVTQNDKDIISSGIKREIYTTSTTPEGAIRVAHDMTKTVVNLAKASSDNNYDEHFELDDSKKIEVMKQNSFKFNYRFDSEGRPTSFVSVFTGKAKSEFDLKAKVDQGESDFVWMRDLDSQELKKVLKDVQDSYKGHAIYGSEEEALLHTHYVIKDKSLYDRMDVHAAEQQISDIKKGIAKRESEMAAIKAAFVKEPLFKAFSSPAETKQFKQFLADLAYEEGDSVSEKELSPAMVEKIRLEKELEDLEGELGINQQLDDQILDDENSGQENENDPRLEDLQNGILNAENQISLNRREFTNQFDKFQRDHQILSTELTQLRNLRKKAKKESEDPLAADHIKQKAQHILSLVSAKEVAQLKSRIQANQEFISEVLQKLKPSENIPEDILEE